MAIGVSESKKSLVQNIKIWKSGAENNENRKGKICTGNYHQIQNQETRQRHTRRKSDRAGNCCSSVQGPPE